MRQGIGSLNGSGALEAGISLSLGLP
jgi:hypothetical protein